MCQVTLSLTFPWNHKDKRSRSFHTFLDKNILKTKIFVFIHERTITNTDTTTNTYVYDYGCNDSHFYKLLWDFVFFCMYALCMNMFYQCACVYILFEDFMRSNCHYGRFDIVNKIKILSIKM